ncbi:MAG: 16S rRNA (guanine(966)-N(2))-methyltransferase RsmD [Nitrosomonas sp.]|nr:16S rRNA (guanine(966)-N(2))-methyltransferase RsmD [Nitrosomonas sp.]
MSKKGVARIIGGQWRSRLIDIPKGGQIRPTPDRVRETLFNWLGQDLTGVTCLDLFAGSGALGFEAASRGADTVVMVEKDAIAMRCLQTSATNLAADKVSLVHKHASNFLVYDQNRYDVIFVDPPFDTDLLFKVLPLLPARLNPNGCVYVESRRKFTTEGAWLIWKQSQAGNVNYCLLKLANG